ncbi:aspartate-semialdehyde dehydrogenase [Candidatus Micrarchaeota archaeon]|nr:aspartate-semialdehyde dehydrogenase [Candidatus Micrarchaeota archaeon]
MKTTILGATGFVGQRFIQLLQGHPWFEVTVLAASERSVGKTYADAAHWLMDTSRPDAVGQKTVVACTPEAVEKAGGVDVVFSCLPNELAGPTEEAFARAGLPVISKASAHRMDADVPLIIPEVNPDHDGLIAAQRKARGWSGFISCDPNCSTTPLALTLKPLLPFGVKRVHVTTLQGLSGAGYPGVASLDALGNVVPYIGGEEEKIERETGKILGRLHPEQSRIETAKIEVSASCNRVPVLEGHLENVFVEFDSDVSVSQVREAWDQFQGAIHGLKLPSAQPPIVYRDEPNRPQHRLDVLTGKGMSTTVGRLRSDGPRRIKYACLSHNTIQGAAGGAILHAEVLKANGALG